jgi:hypothetical protein
VRLHKTLLDNYEFQKMGSEARALLPMLWLLASEDADPISGNVPYSVPKISFRLRLSLEVVEQALTEIWQAGFIECDGQCYESVPASLRNCYETVTPETETETETETENYRAAPSAPLSKYAFEGKVVRITHDQQTKWQGTFTCINVIEHLKGIDAAYAKEKAAGGDVSFWFPRCAQALAKANTEGLSRKGGYDV